ncbi:FGGY family carbohydrate kinase, partial [Salmonella enterica subsp. enterica serovar Yoruba]
RACFAKLDAEYRARVVAIGVSGQQHGFVPLDAAGQVLAPAKLWCDTSTQRECDEIMAAVGGAERCVDIAGNPILAGYTASKLPWTRKHRPDV